MDSRTFDWLVAAAARRPTRRAALRLLAGGLFSGFVSWRGMSARAQRIDSDADGLFDDDETQVYGTDPSRSDTDGDGVGDGEEVYYGTDPVTNEAAAPVEPICLGPGFTCDADAQCCSGARCCFDGVSLSTRCTDVAATGGVCPGEAASCLGPGLSCGDDTQCCAGARCCFDGVTISNRCTDVGPSGGSCPGETTSCSGGLTECGGVCVHLLSDSANCGACGNVCASGGCHLGTCAPSCAVGLTSCSGLCVDLLSDDFNCGFCGNNCVDFICISGTCVVDDLVVR